MTLFPVVISLMAAVISVTMSAFFLLRRCMDLQTENAWLRTELEELVASRDTHQAVNDPLEATFGVSTVAKSKRPQPDPDDAEEAERLERNARRRAARRKKALLELYTDLQTPVDPDPEQEDS